MAQQRPLRLRLASVEPLAAHTASSGSTLTPTHPHRSPRSAVAAAAVTFATAAAAFATAIAAPASVAAAAAASRQARGTGECVEYTEYVASRSSATFFAKGKAAKGCEFVGRIAWRDRVTDASGDVLISTWGEERSACSFRMKHAGNAEKCGVGGG